MPVNPNRVPIPWQQFEDLVEACDLHPQGPDGQRRYDFYLGATRVMHQVRPTKATRTRGPRLQATGWFEASMGPAHGEWDGYPLTDGGHVWVIDAINPHTPMTPAGQPEFVRLLHDIAGVVI